MLFTLEVINGIIAAGTDVKLPVVNLNRTKHKNTKVIGWAIAHLDKTESKDLKILLNKNPV